MSSAELQQHARTLAQSANELGLTDLIRQDLYERFMAIDLTADDWDRQAEYVLQLRDLVKISAQEIDRLLPDLTQGAK